MTVNINLFSLYRCILPEKGKNRGANIFRKNDSLHADCAGEDQEKEHALGGEKGENF
jgi:hypothetical protein